MADKLEGCQYPPMASREQLFQAKPAAKCSASSELLLPSAPATSSETSISGSLDLRTGSEALVHEHRLVEYAIKYPIQLKHYQNWKY